MGEVAATHPSGFVIAGGGAACIAAFLPWMTASAPFIGTISRSGMDGGGDGTIALLIGAGLVVLGLMARRAETSTAMKLVVVLAGLAALGLACLDGGDVSNRISAATAESDLITAAVGPGIYLLGAGGIAAAIGGFLLPTRAPQGVIHSTWAE